MTYSLIIPPEFLGDLVNLRERTGKSIRSMILDAIRKYICEMKSKTDASSLAFENE
jgi:predicted DNA-binding protein